MDRKPDINLKALEALLRHVFGSSPPFTYERTPEGVSTQVYHIERAHDVFYLRVAEERDESLAIDAELLRRLRRLGVRVPEVVYVDPFEVGIGRSVLITTEIPGAPLASAEPPDEAMTVVRSAGHDLALLNQIPVAGFGWVRRDGAPWPLRGEMATYAEFVTQYLPDDWPGSLASLFTPSQLVAFEQLIKSEQRRPVEEASLAHGDFDVTHILQKDGKYSGLIDFGEIRGTEPFFDLAHFYLNENEEERGHYRQKPWHLLPALLEGYRDVVDLPDDHMTLIHRSALLLGLRQLSRWVGPERNRPPNHPSVKHRAARLGKLLSKT